MTLARLFAVASISLAASQAAPAIAQAADWTVRCNLALGSDKAPESGKYLFLTNGKVSDPALARLDYSATVSARAAVYPTAAKDLLNPFSSPSLGIGYYGLVGASAPYAVKAVVGHVSFGSIGKDFKTIPGSPASIKLVIDGVSFGPFEPNPSSLGSGMYNVWLDTAGTDGDGKPPILNDTEFAKIAKAVEAMKTAEIILVQDGVDVVKTSISTPQLSTWRDGLAAWATKTKPGVGAATSCRAGGETVN